LESGADWLWANDSNPEMKAVLEGNLREVISLNQGKITYQDANRVFFACYQRQDYYDLVDVDGFGSPSPVLNSALWATKIGGLLYLTSTDGRTATGHLPEKSLRVYGAYARCHPAAQEQALRLLLGRVQQQAASMNLGIAPVFSFFTGSTYRVMVRLSAPACLTAENYGFLAYCHHCGAYQTLPWAKLARLKCAGDGQSLTVTGPMWLGNLHEPGQVKRMHDLALQLEWLPQAQLLSIMASEATLPPYFYTLREIGRRGKMDIPKRSQLIEALQSQGYRATATHINPQAIKTDASFATCIEIARQLW
jgi:tRNA (guanine26-N2/guanine27-N2)-dimethyltransferase